MQQPDLQAPASAGGDHPGTPIWGMLGSPWKSKKISAKNDASQRNVGYGGPNHMILVLRGTRSSRWNRARYWVHHWGARGMLSSAAPPKAPPDLFSPFRNKDILPYSQPDPSFENEFLIPWQNRESFSSCHELSLYIRVFLLCASCWVWGYSGRRFLKFCVHCFSLFWWQNCHSRVGWIHKMICPRLILMQYAETEAEQFKWSWFYNLLFLLLPCKGFAKPVGFFT